MKTREIDPQNIGQREDWLGNNAAFECPVCSKVYLVSGFLKKERRCPNCAKSLAQITGSSSKGGTASIIWDEAPAFKLGQKYSRKEIHGFLGGQTVGFLPNADGKVVCGCFNKDCNPEAPGIVIPGTGPEIERATDLFATQGDSIPVFMKHVANEWEYVGYYKVERFSKDPADIAKHHKGSKTALNEVTGVLFLKRVF